MNRFLIFFLISFVIHLALGAVLISRTGILGGSSDQGASAVDAGGEPTPVIDQTEITPSPMETESIAPLPPPEPPSPPPVVKKPIVKKTKPVVKKAPAVKKSPAKKLDTPTIPPVIKKEKPVVKKLVSPPTKPKSSVQKTPVKSDLPKKADTISKSEESKTPSDSNEKKEEELMDEEELFADEQEASSKTGETSKEKIAQDFPKSEKALKEPAIEDSKKPEESKSKSVNTEESKTSSEKNSPSQEEEEKPIPEFNPASVRGHNQLIQQSGNPLPEYPNVALENKWEGRVEVIYYVNSAGLVEKIQISRSSGHTVLDNSALKALARYRYHPGQEGWVNHPVEFFLDKSSEVQLTTPLRTKSNP